MEMVCGSKCFVIEFEKGGKRKSERVIARTPAKARKVLRRKMGTNSNIISVKERVK